MKRSLFIVLAALVIGGCSNTEMGKAQRHADPVPSGTVMQEDGGTADPGGSGTDRKDADEPAKQASGQKDGTSEDKGSEPDKTRGAGTEGTKTTASQQQAGAQASSLPRLDAARLANTYGFADNTGKYILSFENMEADDLDTAIGKDGRPLNIRFVKKQPQGPQDNGTRSANNFSNVQGLLYEVVDGNAEPNETYYLANSGRFNVASLLQVKPEIRVGASDEVKRNIEAAKSQKIEKIWKIADIAPDKELYVVQFRKRGKKITASLVLREGERIAAKDFTADYDPVSTWRVDDGGEMTPGMFSVLFAASGEGGVVLCVAWAGAEGENDYIFKQKGNELADLNLTTGRYMSY